MNELLKQSEDNIASPASDSIPLVSQNIPTLKITDNLPSSKQFMPANSRSMTPIDDETSLNDDLLSICSNNHSSYNIRSQRSRLSVDSMSFRRSFDSSSMFLNRSDNRSPLFENELHHSGSVDFSPLGNNSIYEIVMNTRRKGWLRQPTINDIPPVILSRYELTDNWKNKIDEYLHELKNEYSIFKNMNSLTYFSSLDKVKSVKNCNYKLSSKNANISSSESDAFSHSKELKDIPDFYFDKNFNLDNPRTFKKVLGKNNLDLNLLENTTPDNREQLNKELQSNLSYYLDAVENMLVMEISKSSHKFFHALDDVDKIKTKAQDAINKIDYLREKLKNVDELYVQKKIELLNKRIRRKNVEKLEQGLMQIQLIQMKLEECKKMYDDENFDVCLELVNSINDLIIGNDSADKNVQIWTKNWSYKLLDLKSLPALLQIKESLNNIKIEIAGKYSLKFVQLLLSDIQDYMDSQKFDYTLTMLYTHKDKDRRYLDVDNAFRNSVKDLVQKLISCEELTKTFKLYEETFIKELKNIIKINLPKESGDNLNELAPDLTVESIKSSNTGSKLSRLIKEQTPNEFQNMLVSIFVQEINALRRLSMHQKLLLDISLNETHSDMAIYLDIRTSINEGIRIIQLRMGKIISVRRDLTSQLRFDHFLKFYSICLSFIQESESITGEFLTKYLSDVLVIQIKNYTTFLISANIRTLHNKIDNEKWVPYVVNTELQSDVNDILSSVDIDPLTWKNLLNLTSNDVGIENKTQEENKGHKKSVVVGDKTFVASESLIFTIQMLKSIMVLSINLPSCHLSVFETASIDLLKAFNNYTIMSVSNPGEKKISTKTGKNLSIMGESLDCLAEFITILQCFYHKLGSQHKDYTCLPSQNYSQLLEQFQASSDKLYQSHAPPPPS